MRRLVPFLLIVFIIAVIYHQRPDIERYLRMKEM
jgi:hypothetical protein